MKSGNMNTIVSEKAIPRSALQVWKEEIIFSSLKPWRIWSRFSHKKHPLSACKVKKIKSYQENDKKSIFSEVNKVAKSCLMESGLIAQSIKKGDEELWSIEKETSRHDKEKNEAGNRRYNYIDLSRKEADT